MPVFQDSDRIGKMKRMDESSAVVLDLDPLTQVDLPLQRFLRDHGPRLFQGHTRKLRRIVDDDALWVKQALAAVA